MSASDSTATEFRNKYAFADGRALSLTDEEGDTLTRELEACATHEEERRLIDTYALQTLASQMEDDSWGFRDDWGDEDQMESEWDEDRFAYDENFGTFGFVD